MVPHNDRCEEVQKLAPELALGIADGEQRARALEHLAVCATCRTVLAELAAIADDLIDLAPDQEPPTGFESRVLERLRSEGASHPARGRLRLRRGPLGLAAAATVAAAATAIALVLAFSDDRRLASQYRESLAEANGQYFQAAPLRARSGARVGTVFAYEGSPAWVFYVVERRYARGTYRERLITRSGRSIALPRFRFVSGSWGIATRVPLRDVEKVRLVRAPSGPALEARLPRVER